MKTTIRFEVDLFIYFSIHLVTFYDNFHWLQTNCCYRFLFFMVDQHIDQDSYIKVWFVDATENRVRMRPMQ